jgi:hypothetical protein
VTAQKMLPSFQVPVLDKISDATLRGLLTNSSFAVLNHTQNSFSTANMNLETVKVQMPCPPKIHMLKHSLNVAA